MLSRLDVMPTLKASSWRFGQNKHRSILTTMAKPVRDQPLKLLIGDSCPHRRVRLKEILKENFFKATIVSARNPRDEIIRTSAGQQLHAVFTSPFKPWSDFIGHLETIRSQTKALGAKLIVCLPVREQQSSLVAELYMVGVDGFLCEPYSPDEVKRLFDLFEELAEEPVPTSNKHNSIANFLIDDACRKVSKLADRKRKGQGGGFDLKDLKRISSQINGLMPSLSEEKYVDLLMHHLSKAEPAQYKVAESKKGRKPKKLLPGVHPGKVVQDIMDSRGLTKDRLLDVLKIEAEEFDQLLEQKLVVTKPIARELARVLGETASYWVEMQAAFERDNPKNVEEQPAEQG